MPGEIENARLGDLGIIHLNLIRLPPSDCRHCEETSDDREGASSLVHHKQVLKRQFGTVAIHEHKTLGPRLDHNGSIE